MFHPAQDSSVWLGLTSREQLMSYILYIFIYIFRTVFKSDKSLKMLLDTNDKIEELYNQRSNELHSKFTLNIHVIAYSFPLLLRSDLETIQHITVKDILDDNIFY